MAGGEGTEIGKAYITVEPKVDTAAFAAKGKEAGDILAQNTLTPTQAGFLTQRLKSVGGSGGAALSAEFNSKFNAGLAASGTALETTSRSLSQRIGSGFSAGFSGLQMATQAVTGSLGTMVNGAVGAGKSVSTAMNSISSTMNSLSRQIGVTAFNIGLVGGSLDRYVTIPFMAAAGAASTFGIKMATTIENAGVQLRAFLQNGEDVDALIKRLTAESIASPVFDLGQILSFTKGLIGAGQTMKSAEAETSALDKIFTAYGVTGESVQNMLLGFSQVQSKGVAQSEELTKQISQQIPIWQLLSQVTGKSQADLRMMVKAQDISGQQFADLVVKMGNLPSILQGASEGSKTLSAQWAQMKENLQTRLGIGFLSEFPQIKDALAHLTTGLNDLVDIFLNHLPGAIKALGNFIDKLGQLDEMYKSLTPRQKEFLDKLILGLVAAGPALLLIGRITSAFGALSSVITFLTNPAGLMFAGIALAIAGVAFEFDQLYKSSAKFRDEVERFETAFAKGWNDKVKPAFDELKKTVMEDLLPALVTLAKALFGEDINGKKVGDWASSELAKDIKGFSGALKDLSTAINQVSSAVDLLNGKKPPSSEMEKWWIGLLHAGAPGTPTNEEPEPFRSIDGWMNSHADKWREGFVHWWDDTIVVWAKKIGKAWEDSWNFVLGHADQAMNILRVALRSTWVWIEGLWNDGTAWVAKTWNDMWDGLAAKFISFKSFLTVAIVDLVKALSSAWTGLQHVFGDPINFVINDVYDKGIKSLVEQGGAALGLSISLPQIEPIHFASGGQVPGSRSQGDWVPAWLTAGERVLSLQQVAMLGGHSTIDKMVGGGNRGNGHYDIGGIVNDIIGIGKDIAFGGPGHVLGSFSGLLNALHSSLGSLGNNTGARMAAAAGNKLLDAASAKLNPFDKAPVKATFVPGTASAGAVPTAISGDLAGWIAAGIQVAGVGADWIGPLNTLIMRESGGDPNSINNWDINAQHGDPSRGLMQTIGATFEAYRDSRLPDNIYDPVANIVAGIRYILSQYGTIFNVQQAVGATPMGYDNGGIVPPGLSLINNKSGVPESLWNNADTKAIKQGMSDRGGDNKVYVSVMLDGSIIADQVECAIDNNNRATIQGLRSGRRIG